MVLDTSGVANLVAIVLRLLLISKAAARKMVKCPQKRLNSNTSLHMLPKTVMLSYMSSIMLANHVEEVYDKKGPC